jgi:glycosyltransferase involved in cell wall biosynthesis
VTAWHIVTCEYPPRVGGVSDHTRHLAEALAAAGDEVHVWCPPVEHSTSAAVHVHPALGRFRARDWWRVERALAAFASPRRLLVQWVPHGFGYHSMNPWVCLWLLVRAMAGDRVELFVHEPFIELRPRPLRHAVIAVVHRLMTVVLLWSASRVWLATSAWEARLRPFALGRSVRMDWLPVLTGRAGSSATRAARLQASLGSTPVVGHFGTYGPGVARLLEERLVPALAGPAQPSVLLLGAGSDAFRADLVARHPGLSSRVHALGYVEESELGPLVDMCDLWIQPYPDGMTTRRTSALTCLARGRPVVSTAGHLTEPLWRERRAVALADVVDPGEFTAIVGRLLAAPVERGRRGEAGRCLYEERFAGRHVLRALRAA